MPVTFPPSIQEFFTQPIRPPFAPVNRRSKRVTPAPFLPFTLQDFASHLRTDTPLGSNVTDDDTHALALIATSVEFIENYTATPILKSVYTTTFNKFEGSCLRLVYPVLESNPGLSLTYFTAADPTIPVVMPTTDYYVADEGTIQLVGGPPTPLRVTSGISVTYNSGYIDYPAILTPLDIQTAQASVNPQDRLAAYNLMGFLFESREGDPAIPTKYQAEAKLSNLTPNVIAMLLGARYRWRLDGLV